MGIPRRTRKSPSSGAFSKNVVSALGDIEALRNVLVPLHCDLSVQRTTAQKKTDGLAALAAQLHPSLQPSDASVATIHAENPPTGRHPFSR